MGNAYDGVFCLLLTGGDDRGGRGPALAVDAVEGEEVEAGQGRGLRSVLLSRRDTCTSRICSRRPRGPTGNPRGSARGAQAATREGTGVGAVPGKFILILVWAIRMTSCFVSQELEGQLRMQLLCQKWPAEIAAKYARAYARHGECSC